MIHVFSWKGQFAQPLSQSGKKNIEKTEKCHRRSRLCAVMMMAVYLWIVFTHHLDDDDITELTLSLTSSYNLMIEWFSINF